MIINKKELKNKIEFKNKTKSKKYLIENIEAIINDIQNNKNLTKLDKTIEYDKKILDYYKMKNKSKINITYLINDKIEYILNIIRINDNIIFIIREEEIEKYFKNYFKQDTIENIQNLNNEDIISKLNEFDFLIIENDNMKYITLLHLKNDFEIK